MRRSAMLAVLIAAALGCSGDRVTGASHDRFRVIIVNNSNVALTDVHVTAGVGSTLAIGRLDPGSASPSQVVAEVHRDVAVTATAEGQSLSAIPVEGFSPGFNPSLEPASYVVLLMVSNPPRSLTVEVKPTVDPP